MRTADAALIYPVMRPFFGDVPASRIRSFSTAVATCLVLFVATAAGRGVTVDTEDNSSTVADGKTSLLEALQGQQPGDTIRFAIPGAGPHRIKTPVGGYPLVTQDGITIDGYSQPGAKPNTRDILSGNDAVLAIYLDSTDDTSAGDPSQPDRSSTRLPFSGYGPSENAVLAVHGADHVRIKGLGFLARHTEGSRADPSIYCVALVDGAEDCRVQGCRFGLDPDGTTLRGGASAVAGFRHRVENDMGDIVDSFSGGLVFGTDGDGVADVSEPNVAVDMHITLALELPRAKIAGNYFNVLPDGVTFVPVDQIRRHLLAVGRTGGDATVENIENGRFTDGTVIGTDGDGVSDAAERNVFDTAFHDHLIEFYGDAKDIVVAGNYFGVGVDGTTRAPAATGVAPGLLAFAGAGNVRIGSDGDGRSDALEGNRIVGIPGSRFVDAPPGLRILARRNEVVGCAFAGFPFADGDVNGLYSDHYSDVLADAFSSFPVVTSTAEGFLVGTLPGVLTDQYPLSEVDVYLADPASVTNGPALPGLYLMSFRDNGAVDLDPAADAFKVPLGGLAIPPASRLVLAVGYSRTVDGFGPAGTPVTGPLSAAVAATAVEVAAPVFTEQPVGATRPEGAGITFSAAAAGSGVIFQWKLDGKPVVGATDATYTIAAVGSADSGDYTVVASNGGGSVTSRPAKLTVVVVAPVFTLQPVAATRLEGVGITFKAEAAGSGVAYQWRHGGTPIAGATNSVHAITAASAADAGDYTVVASNGGGSVTSQAARLTVVVVAPVFTVQPVGARRVVGTSVVLTAAVDGIGLSYQWRLGGKPVPGATNISHTIAAVALADAGDYTVVASNGGGSVTSQAAKLTVVVAPPVFTLQPVGATRALGASVVFTSAAEGTGVTYQWRFGGRPIAGATKASHTIASVTASSAGDYLVVASNPGGSVASQAAKLTVVVPAPVFTIQPVGVTRPEGTAVVFTAAADGVGVTYQWERGGNPIVGATKSVLEIAAIASADAGDYTVVARNLGGSVTSQAARLVVASLSPIFTVEPVGSMRLEGDGVVFTASAEGVGVTYQWKLDGKPVPGATAGTYTIAAVVLADAGDYTVVASNSGGSATSRPASLTVVPSTDVRPGLVAHLKFDDSYADASGNGSDARGKGTKNQPMFEGGRIGKGVRITNKKDGTADAYVSLGYPAPLRFGDGSTGTDFSLSMWVKIISQADDQALVSNKDWSNIGNRGWGLFSQEDGAFRVNVASANGTVADRPKAGLKDGDWHLLTVSVSRRGSVDSYVDGLPVSSARVPVLGDIDTDGLGLSVNIGQDGTGTYTDFGSAEIDMVVDDLGLWRRKLEAPEILAIYLRGLAGKSLDQPPAPRPLVLTSPSVKTAGLVLEWSGGTGPFIVQGKLGLTDAWSDLKTTTERTAVLPVSAQSGFLRIVDGTTDR